jgi:hypothetical protein
VGKVRENGDHFNNAFFPLIIELRSDYFQGVVQGLLRCLREEEDSVRFAAER